jgi:hypothetical protein
MPSLHHAVLLAALAAGTTRLWAARTTPQLLGHDNPPGSRLPPAARAPPSRCPPPPPRPPPRSAPRGPRHTTTLPPTTLLPLASDPAAPATLYTARRCRRTLAPRPPYTPLRGWAFVHPRDWLQENSTSWPRSSGPPAAATEALHPNVTFYGASPTPTRLPPSSTLVRSSVIQQSPARKTTKIQKDCRGSHRFSSFSASAAHIRRTRGSTRWNRKDNTEISAPLRNVIPGRRTEEKKKAPQRPTRKTKNTTTDTTQPSPRRRALSSLFLLPFSMPTVRPLTVGTRKNIPSSLSQQRPGHAHTMRNSHDRRSSTLQSRSTDRTKEGFAAGAAPSARFAGTHLTPSRSSKKRSRPRATNHRRAHRPARPRALHSRPGTSAASVFRLCRPCPPRPTPHSPTVPVPALTDTHRPQRIAEDAS